MAGPRTVVTTAALGLVLAGCSGQGADGVGAPGPGGGPAAADEPPVVTAGDFAGQDFARSTVVDHPWFPLRPGTRLAFTGSALDEGERVRRDFVTTVTGLTKVVGGVRVVVTYDQDFDDGVLAESELAFFAQDTDGNVWHMGEYPEEREEGRVVATPAWVHGVAGATAGLSMRAVPRPEDPDYAQGFAPPPVHWVDRARVLHDGASTCVRAGCFDSVVVTEEFEPDKPGAVQLKYYASGVGNVRVGWSGAKELEREVLELVEVRRLSAAELAAVHREAQAQDARGYRLVRDVYRHTTPAR